MTLLLVLALWADARVLRVCADPANPPLSTRAGDGLENRLAELLAAELGARLEYEWRPQRRGFFRETLKAGRCDVVLGVPAQLELVLATKPYYRSAYVFVTRGGTPPPSSLDDPRLRTLRLGVPLVGDDGANPPPVHALARRGIVDNLVAFPVYDGAERLVEAVEKGEVDAAIGWGPAVGRRAARAGLRVTRVAPERDGPYPFAFDIAAGVRRGDTALRDELDRALSARAEDVGALLREFHVP